MSTRGHIYNIYYSALRHALSILLLTAILCLVSLVRSYPVQIQRMPSIPSQRWTFSFAHTRFACDVTFEYYRAPYSSCDRLE